MKSYYIVNKVTTGIVTRLRIVDNMMPCEMVDSSICNFLDSISGMFPAGTDSIRAAVFTIKGSVMKRPSNKTKPIGSNIYRIAMNA